MGAARVLKPVSVADYPNRLAGWVYAQLLRHEGVRRVFISDMRLQLGDVDYYPDVMAVCADDPDPYQKTRPCAVVEVLSPSTRDTDLLEKELAYTGIASPEAYPVFDADRASVRGFYRSPNGFEERRWASRGQVEVPCLSAVLDIQTLYRNL